MSGAQMYPTRFFFTFLQLFECCMVKVSVNSDPAHIDRQSGFRISASIRVVILKPKATDAQFFKFKHIEFSKQSTEPGEYEIYPNSQKLQIISQ